MISCSHRQWVGQFTRTWAAHPVGVSRRFRKSYWFDYLDRSSATEGTECGMWLFFVFICWTIQHSGNFFLQSGNRVRTMEDVGALPFLRKLDLRMCFYFLLCTNSLTSLVSNFQNSSLRQQCNRIFGGSWSSFSPSNTRSLKQPSDWF